MISKYCRLRSVKVFSEQHEMFRATVRAFVDKEVAPHVEEWEAAGRMPKTLWRRMGELGFFGLEISTRRTRRTSPCGAACRRTP
jgi:alkylation response protein AidB-like acyl-CoA dehydrogenase